MSIFPCLSLLLFLGLFDFSLLHQNRFTASLAEFGMEK